MMAEHRTNGHKQPMGWAWQAVLAVTLGVATIGAVIEVGSTELAAQPGGRGGMRQGGGQSGGQGVPAAAAQPDRQPGGRQGGAGQPDGSAAAQPVDPQTPHTLAWKFAPGEKQPFTLLEEVEEKTIDRGRQISQRRRTQLTFMQEVKAVDTAGVAELAVTFERVQYRHTTSLNPTAPVDFDSNARENLDRAQVDPSLKPFAALVGHTIAVFVTPRGDVRRVTGYAELLDRVFDNLTDETFSSLKAALRTQFSNETMARQLGQLYHLLPDRAVRVGDTWTGQSVVPMPFVGRLTVAQTYRLERVESLNGRLVGTVAVASVYDQPEGVAPPAATGIDGFHMTGRLKRGTLNGTFEFDIAAGQVVGSSLAQRMGASFSAHARGGELDDLRLDVETEVDGRITLRRGGE